MKPTYEQLIRAKQEVAEFSAAPCVEVRSHLFPYQSDLVRWALARGRAAIFADTGLGKAAMLLEWARNVSTEGRVLFLFRLERNTARPRLWAIPTAFLPPIASAPSWPRFHHTAWLRDPRVAGQDLFSSSAHSGRKPIPKRKRFEP